MATTTPKINHLQFRELQRLLVQYGIELTGEETPELIDDMIEALAAEEGVR